MSAINDFRSGLYRHYKGPLYQALFLAHDANADTLMDSTVDCWPDERQPMDDRVVVVYIALGLDQAHTGIRPAVRTLEDWNALVEVSAGGVLRRVPRFEFVGTEYQP